jgi:predicted ribosome quality control (RQC) complex YloA/Tae2 family protein
MITNYYTLFHIAAEFNREFGGRMVDDLFTQHRGELIVSFKETPAVILIGCEPAHNYVYAQNSFARARRNSASIFHDVSGTMIENIVMHPTDRQMYFHLNDARAFVAQSFGSKANVLLLNSAGGIVETFLKKTNAKSTSLEPSSVRQTIPSQRFLSEFGDQLLTQALKQTYPQFGTVLVQELLARTGINGEQSVASLPDTERERLLSSAKRLMEELLSSPSPRVYFDGISAVRLSVIPLEHLSEFQFQKFNSVSEAIATYRAKVHHEKSVLQEKEEIVKLLEHEYEHAERTLQKITVETERANRAELYKKYGKLLMSQLHSLKKGDTAAVVEDFISGSNELVEIPLDRFLTPAKNAERYFEKADKSRHAAEEQRQHAAELTKRQKSISRLLDRLEEVVTGDDLHRCTDENREELSQFGLKAKKSEEMKEEKPSPFRVFTVAGGFQVWAGKSGENNDLLSTRHTANNDLWFHARGVGGSHVVLKIGTGKGEVSKQAIEQAAAIAAYYSKMKKSKLVPVTMCEGKYVRKPKGAPAGTVTVEREKTIFAEPALPQNE